MARYWISWAWLTILKAVILTGSIYGAVGGILHFNEYALLAIIFIPCSIMLLHDFIHQLLVPIYGGQSNDTPMFMGIAPSWKEAREDLKKGYAIIWS